MDRFSEIVKQRLAASDAGEEHPAADLLCAFAEQSLRAPERERVTNHLARCSSCRAAVALALPEFTQEPATKPARPSLLHFPAAMRWASAGAALAIAVTVGLVIHQEQSHPKASPEVALKQARTMASPQAPEPCDPANPGCGTPTAATKPVEESKPANPSASEGRAASLARNALPAQPRAKVPLASVPESAITQAAVAHLSQQNAASSAPEPQAPVVGALSKRQQSGANAAALDAFVGAPAASGMGPGSAAGVGGAAFKVNSTAPAKAAKATAQPEYSLARAAPSAKRESASAFAGGAIAGMLNVPIANWSISSAGQLQRRNWDDTVTLVNPASGATFRAVAAQGIEVWAGGSQQVAGSANPILVHSSDAGTTWKQVTGPWKGTVLRLQLASGGVVTLIAADGQWQTRDGGQSWIAVPGS